MKRSGIRRKSPMKQVSARRLELDKQWQAMRRLVKTRAGGLCEARTVACRGEGSQAHHVIRRSQGGSNQPDNLLWVCGSPGCHEYIHGHPEESFEAGWLKHAPVNEV